MIAKRTTFSAAPTGSLKDFEAATKDLRNDGAPDDATVTVFLGGYGPQFKAEWEVIEPDPAAPAADVREQPVSYATGGVVDGEPVSVLVHEGESILPNVQPDGIINETPQAGR